MGVSNQPLSHISTALCLSSKLGSIQGLGRVRGRSFACALVYRVQPALEILVRGA